MGNNRHKKMSITIHVKPFTVIIYIRQNGRIQIFLDKFSTRQKKYAPPDTPGRFFRFFSFCRFKKYPVLKPKTALPLKPTGLI